MYDVFHAEGKPDEKPQFEYFTTTNQTEYVTEPLTASRVHSFEVRLASVYGHPGAFTSPESVYVVSSG